MNSERGEMEKALAGELKWAMSVCGDNHGIPGGCERMENTMKEWDVSLGVRIIEDAGRVLRLNLMLKVPMSQSRC